MCASACHLGGSWVAGSPASAHSRLTAQLVRISSCQPVASQAGSECARGLGSARSSSVQPPPENSPCLVPGAPLAEGAAAADQLSLSKKQRADLCPPPAPAPRGAGEEEETQAFCAGDSWARLGIFPGCGHPRVSGTPRARRAPGTWSRPGPGRERLLHRRLWTWGPCPVPSPCRPSPLEASESSLFCPIASLFPGHLSQPPARALLSGMSLDW